MKNGWYKDVVVLRRGGKETAGAGMKNNNQYYVVRNVIKPQAVHLATKSHAHMSHGRLTGYTKENDFIKEAQQDGERAFDELLEQRFEKV